MGRNNIVLILGAGSSIPYGFPSGRDLIFDIVQRVGRNAKSDSKRILLQVGFSQDEIDSFSDELIGSNQPSIDAFLENRREYIEVGKAAIAATLIPREVPDYLTRRQTEQRWYEYLYQQLGAQQIEFPKHRSSIITFNYDRSLEYFLYNSIKHSYGTSDEETLALFKSIPKVHIYGQLGVPHFIGPDNTFAKTRRKK
jgi:hypothetical protein